MDDTRFVREKLDQAVQLLDPFGLDLWLTFVQETGLRGDPALVLIYPHDVTWQSAFLVGRGGERLAIVGRYDAAAVREHHEVCGVNLHQRRQEQRLRILEVLVQDELRRDHLLLKVHFPQ